MVEKDNKQTLDLNQRKARDIQCMFAILTKQNQNGEKLRTGQFHV